MADGWRAGAAEAAGKPSSGRRRSGRTAALALMLLSGSAASAEVGPTARECVGDVAASAALIQRFYPGYHEKIARHAPEVSEAFQKAMRAAAKTAAPHDCDPLLFAYLQSFHEGHIFFLPEEHGTSAGALKSISGDAPSAGPLSSETFYIRVPSFFPEHRAELDALLQKDARAIERHPFLVIDIRGNHGGADETYAGLLPWIATGPIHRSGIEAVADPELADSWLRAMDEIPAGETPAREEVRRGWELLKSAPSGHRVTIRPDRTIVPGTRPAIRRVAILIDGGVASSGEQFLLDAKQSSKVILVGSHSSGTLDYGDVRPFPLPSGERALWIPTTSSTRLPARPIDATGIAPDVPSSLTGSDLVRLSERIVERPK